MSSRGRTPLAIPARQLFCQRFETQQLKSKPQPHPLIVLMSRNSTGNWEDGPKWILSSYVGLNPTRIALIELVNSVMGVSIGLEIVSISPNRFRTSRSGNDRNCPPTVKGNFSSALVLPANLVGRRSWPLAFGLARWSRCWPDLSGGCLRSICERNVDDFCSEHALDAR
ncbi:hypothetical protein J7T55_010981 [Diaporthe amygdali]|uniref:uncharacterized protein n=1 Tax=Phomopsis amygdali TaxID=1214568 RepID=UPI0022FED43E|nr:uncharacterized protein J7T55_010981 [Diaporthe amygdali]KAJ0103964.1 hypothetical protein J7T55_010981 [Diaporthe amygdali]